MTSPSHFAERVLGIVVRDPEWREAVIGDLREEHARLSARVGAARARRWHTQQSLRIACRYGTHRLLRRGTPPPRWLAIAAQEPGGSWTRRPVARRVVCLARGRRSGRPSRA